MMKKYNIIKLPKGNGKFRTIYAPDEKYKNLLKKINIKLTQLLKRRDFNNVNHAFLSNRNCVTNAEQHIGYKYTLSMDLEDFFDSVKSYMVEEYLYDEYIRLCFIDDIARQGLPTSPTISNLAFIKIDSEIQKEISIPNVVVYTRYADDLTFSFNDASIIPEIINVVRSILERNGFTLNESKTKIQDSRNGRRIITGVAVDDIGVYPTRKIIKKIRAAKHQENEPSLIGLKEWSKCKVPNKRT